MKWLGRPSPFHLFTNPCVINRFIFGQGLVIYYIRTVTDSYRSRKVSAAWAGPPNDLNMDMLRIKYGFYTVKIG